VAERRFGAALFSPSFSYSRSELEKLAPHRAKRGRTPNHLHWRAAGTIFLNMEGIAASPGKYCRFWANIAGYTPIAAAAFAGSFPACRLANER
jgi:hypothetical protein